MVRLTVICPAVTSVLMLISIILLLLSMTVYKKMTPITTVDVVALRHIDMSRNVPEISVDVNMSVMNPNGVAFKYTHSTVLLVYRGVLVGEALIEAGVISKAVTKTANLMLASNLADRLQGESELIMIQSDILAGTLPFNIQIKISGRLFSLLKIFKFHTDAVSTSSCQFDINVCSKTVREKHCPNE
ncbi:PREDICTED: late embryogenesis abundant [Prunus dulcis]|uniref:PREDICTED: late embryogenesis abundant n=1 Tax=Prunus dulcis TaxID=3755 RepID=A0A5E4EHN0_PRUDU|nr:uncharacterized protein LOC117630562 [Prunus dulcis]VVA14489.1 PREDICTED: late embryogenesis abundant [Prunus dulcis]